MKPQPPSLVGLSMTAADPYGKQHLFSPLARALLDRFAEAVILFDPDGRVTYANRPGEKLLQRIAGGSRNDTGGLLPRLGRMGARVERLVVGTMTLGNAVYVPVQDAAETLASRERDAIVGTLNATGWRLTETARRLGISRTTLWRRLREWGVDAPGNHVGS